MAKASIGGVAVTPLAASASAATGAAQPPLDLSLGHIGTRAQINAPLQPARTREDCIGWLTLEEVEREVFAAFVGAQRHTRTWDFERDALDLDPDCALQPGTVVSVSGDPWWDRAQHLEYMLAGVVWRLVSLAESKGVKASASEVADTLRCRAFQQEGFKAPYFAPLGGAVQTITNADSLFEGECLGQDMPRLGVKPLTRSAPISQTTRISRGKAVGLRSVSSTNFRPARLGSKRSSQTRC